MPRHIPGVLKEIKKGLGNHFGIPDLIILFSLAFWVLVCYPVFGATSTTVGGDPPHSGVRLLYTPREKGGGRNDYMD